MRIPNLPPLKTIEKEYILKVVAECGENYVTVAKVLQISRTTLWRRLKEYKINVKGFWNKEAKQ